MNIPQGLKGSIITCFNNESYRVISDNTETLKVIEYCKEDSIKNPSIKYIKFNDIKEIN